MPRNPRRIAVLVGAAVIVICVVSIVSFTAGRAGNGTATPSSGSTIPSTPSISPALPTPSYSATNQQGSPEPALARGAAIAGQGGRASGTDGLPLGYSHDQAGAVSAATNYLMWMNSLRITDQQAAASMATAAAADASTRSALIQSFNELRSGMSTLKADQIYPARGAYAVRSYAAAKASIYIWAPEVSTDTSGTTDQVWAIDVVDVVWANNDWKLDRGLIAKTGGAAVDPVDPSGDPTAAEKHAILTRSPADPGEVQDSAEQTWFEYANAPH